MSIANGSSKLLVLVKHAQPVLDPDLPPRLWHLGPEGEAQSRQLAWSLKPFLPFVLACSTEPKAMRTAEIVGAQLGVPPRAVKGLEELDRPALPILSPQEHERLNARIFERPSSAEIGRESAEQALARFSLAVADVLDAAPPDHNVAVIAHGTVISLLVAQHTGTAAFDLWKTLRCGELMTLPRSVLRRGPFARRAAE